MTGELPKTSTRSMAFRNGSATGLSQRWEGGQYCSILTPAGLVGCGIYDLKVAAKFSQAMAIARGTPSNPLVEPEDLLDAKIVEATPRARELGVEVGMTGREAVERMLGAPLTPPSSRT